jgi:cell division protease FtsH
MIFGMSDSAGLAHWGGQPNQFIPWMGDGALQRDCSEATARMIDEEMRKILDDAHAEAKRILQENRNQLEVVAKELLERETMDAPTFMNLIEKSGEAAPS